ncbi:MAG: metalloregulator ArsR/SmtB family transcription factor [Methylorubrum rhodinum]|uniref:ArsR/SmtB family transcription factor n=1 Tax=Methylorubrum rhodinum TaxID=29428 RepID=UPI003BB1F894
MSSANSLGTASPTASVPFTEALAVLRAAAEETRLRILALLAEGELSVSDLTDILGQSQPRISRHLKLLVESGLIERHREGAWAFFRLREAAAGFVEPLIAALRHEAPPLSEDRARLDSVRAQRADAAQTFFARLAPKWDRLRSLHVPEATVEAAVLDALGDRPIRHVVDLGTGTGKMLALLAPRAGRATGLDSSHAMLSVARANLERAGLPRVDLRQGDLHAPPFGRAGFDLVVLHQVLHYLDDPARALREAARLVAPGGRLLVVDFAPHAQEHLRETQAHRRLGFAAEQVTGWLVQAGLGRVESRDLAPDDGTEHPLTVTLWLAQDIAQDVAENLTQNAVSLRPAAPDERAVA